ncbi:MAG TPA: hypothetical protein VGD99_22025 [Anaerolineae bacterium]
MSVDHARQGLKPQAKRGQSRLKSGSFGRIATKQGVLTSFHWTSLEVWTVRQGLKPQVKRGQSRLKTGSFGRIATKQGVLTSFHLFSPEL